MGNAENVDAERPRPVTGLAVPQRAEPAGHAGVVDQEVDLAAARDDGSCQLVHRRGIGDVADVRMHDEAPAGEGGPCGFERARLDVRQDDREATGAQGFGQRKPDAAGRTGDDGNLSIFQFHVNS